MHAVLPYDPDALFCAWCGVRECRRGGPWVPCTPARYAAMLPHGSHGCCPDCAALLKADRPTPALRRKAEAERAR